jgi:glycosyltransferase involved in cell wall biosynthesis
METRKGILDIESYPALVQLERFITGSAIYKSLVKPRQPEPMISVIVPAHNEGEYLGRTLRALKEQNYSNYEVIVVCNGCTDQTADVARGRCHVLIETQQRGISFARNRGARAARGELLLFLDADTLLEPDALMTIARKFKRTDAAGTLRGVPDSRRLIYHVLYFFKNRMHRLRIHRGSVGVILCWKDDFLATGGFDEHLHVMENSELIKKLCQFGRYRCVAQTPAITSMRRYDTVGPLQTARLWIKIWFKSLVRSVKGEQYETVR